jgi:hypothetical protein
LNVNFVEMICDKSSIYRNVLILLLHLQVAPVV